MTNDDIHPIPGLRPPTPGTRKFICDECGKIWYDESRDKYSPSGEECPVCDEWTFATPVEGPLKPPENIRWRGGHPGGASPSAMTRSSQGAT